MVKNSLLSAFVSAHPVSVTFLLTSIMAATAHAEVVDLSKSSDIPLSDVEKIRQCAQVVDNVARLACYDKANGGENIAERKEPLDLAKTLTTSIQEGKPVAVLANPTQPASVQKTPDENTVVEQHTEKKPSFFGKWLPPKNTKPTVSETDAAVLAQVGVNDKDLASYTPLSILYDLDKNDPAGLLTIRPHLPMYVMPVWYTNTPNYAIQSPTQKVVSQTEDQLQNLDTKTQISFKTKLVQDVFDTNADVWFGYTQQSYWQVYNRHSRPFRSSDYQPEVFITQPVKADFPFGLKLRMLGAGLVHESNGQGDPLSRSWNRAYVMAGTEFGKLTVIPRLWVIGKGSKKESDNPDIADYMGYGDIRWLYDFGDNSTVGGVLRYNPSTQNGAVQLDYAYPLVGGMKAYLQLFHGYGENIQDYNHKSTNVGIGLMFNDFKGL